MPNRAQRRAAGAQPTSFGVTVEMDAEGNVSMTASEGLTPPLMLWMLRIGEKMLMDRIGTTQPGEEQKQRPKIVVPTPVVDGPMRND